MNRREFLGASGAGLLTAPFGSTSPVPAGPNDTINVGIVGPGGRGANLIEECVEYGKKYNARLTAVCDIWSLRRESGSALVAKASGAQPKVYRRYEEMLADRDIDAVIIATPDHSHAKLLVQAVEAGKDVYVEKPMANVLEEANQALDAVRRTKRIVQIGTQRRSYPKYREAARLMREGIVGDIVKVDVVINDYSPYRWAATPEEIAKVRESDTDWKTWLMGKPDRPFDPRIYRSFPPVPRFLQRDHRPVDDPPDRCGPPAHRRSVSGERRGARRHLSVLRLPRKSRHHPGPARVRARQEAFPRHVCDLPLQCRRQVVRGPGNPRDPGVREELPASPEEG